MKPSYSWCLFLLIILSFLAWIILCKHILSAHHSICHGRSCVIQKSFEVCVVCNGWTLSVESRFTLPSLDTWQRPFYSIPATLDFRERTIVFVSLWLFEALHTLSNEIMWVPRDVDIDIPIALQLPTLSTEKWIRKMCHLHTVRLLSSKAEMFHISS